MKGKIVALAITAIITAAIFTSCNSPQKNAETSQSDTTSVPREVIDTPSAAKQDWEKFKSDAREKIRQNEDSIDALQKRMDKAGSKMKAKYDKKIAELEEKNNELKRKLDDFKEEGKEKWEKFKYDFNNAMDTLGEKIK